MKVKQFDTLTSTNLLHLFQAQAPRDPEVATEVSKLREENKDLLEENEQLKTKTVQLHLEIDDLTEMLSRKEAEWCSKEEKLTLEVNKMHIWWCCWFE